MNKATISKDGRYRFSVRLEFRLGRSDLAFALAEALHDEANGGPTLPRWTRSRALEALKAATYRHGAWNSERLSYSAELDEAVERAEAIIDRLFPELADEGRAA